MPKLQQILSTSTLPAVQQPRQTAVGTSGFAEGIAQVGQAVVKGLTTYAEAEKLARKKQVELEAERAESGFEIEVSNLASNLKLSATDPDKLEKDWTKGLQDALGRAREGIRDPDLSQAFERKLPDLLKRHNTEMLKQRNALMVDGIKADLTKTLDDRVQLAGTVPLGDDAAVIEHNAKARAAIMKAVPAISKADAEKLDIDTRNRIIDEYASRELAEDPGGLIDRLDTSPVYRVMDPQKRTDIRARAETALRSKMALSEKALENAKKTWRESVQRETAVHVANRTLSREWLDDYKDAFTDTELGAYYKALDAQTYGGPKGDPAVMDQFAKDVYDFSTRPGDGKPSPTQVRDRLNAARRADKVSQDRYEVWLNHLNGEIQRREDRVRTDQKEGETRVREYQERNYRAAMENIDRAFRTTGGISFDFDKTSEEAAAQFREFIQRNSTYTGRGNQEADALYREHLPRFIGQVTDRMESRVSVIKDQLGIRSSADMTASQLKALETQLPKAAWLEKVRLWDEMRRIEQERERLNNLRKGGGGASATPQAGANKQPTNNPRER